MEEEEEEKKEEKDAAAEKEQASTIQVNSLKLLLLSSVQSKQRRFLTPKTLDTS